MIKQILLPLMMVALLSLYTQAQTDNSQLGKYLAKMKETSQNKDKPQARIQFDLLRTVDPVTGKLPKDIRKHELQFHEANFKGKGSFTRDNLTNWTNRGPYNVGGRTRALAIDVSNENVILAGGVSGGMWRSSDGGQSWTKTTGSNELQSVTGIAQDTRTGHTNTWYYITGEYSGNSASGTGAFFIGNGIYKSVDGGLTWSALSSTTTENPQSWNTAFEINHEIVVDPSSGNVLLANYFGLYLSVDGGNSWTQTLDNVSNGQWADVVVSSTGTAYAYLATVGVLKSTDNGANWSDISAAGFPSLASGDRGELALAASNEDILYLLLEDPDHDSGHGLWRYDGGAESWIDRSSNIPQEGGQTGDFDTQGGYDVLLKVKPDNENFVIIGGTNLYRSTDGFASTTNTDWIGGYTPNNNSYALYQNHHPDQHSFVFYPSDPRKVISGNDGGLQFTADVTSNVTATHPITWTPLNNGYLTTQIYALSIGPQDQILIGLQDNGTWFTASDNPTATWSSPFGGDGAYSAMASDGAMRYMSSQQGNIYRIPHDNANDAGPNNFIQFYPNDFSGDYLFITPFYLDYLNDEIFYLGGTNKPNSDTEEELWVNTSASTGSSSSGWKSIPIPGITGIISEFGVIGNGSTYFGTSSGQVFKVENVLNASPTVTNVSPAEASGAYVSGIGVNKVDPDELIAVVSNYNVKSIFHSTDGGTTWTHVSGNLEQNEDGTGTGPSVRTATILDDGALYIVGTSIGVFTTTSLDGANTAWTQEDVGNLGAVVVEHIVSRNSDNLVVVGTHGNGAYSATLGNSAAIDLGISSISAPTSGILGTESVSIKVTNNGSEDQSGYSLSYEVNSVTQQTVAVTELIPAGSTLDFTFSNSFDFSTVGSYTIAVTVTVEGDENTEDNTLSVIIDSESAPEPVTFPYEEGFEDDSHGWTLNGFWEVGTPAQTFISSASSGTGVLMSDLDGNYPNEVSVSARPPVMDFSNLIEPIVAFDIKYDLESTYDGVVLGYRVNDVDNFTVVSEGLTNWYNDTFEAFGSEGWTGKSDYVRASADLSFLAGESYVELAFFLLSDDIITGEGIAIDQFEIYDDSDLGTLDITNLVVPENGGDNFAVGTLSLSSGEPATFSLTAGTGDTNNDLFEINGVTLIVKGSLNFEENSSLSIRVASATSIGTVNHQLIITVEDENDLPTDLSITNSEIEENSALGTLIGTFLPEDEDLEDVHTYEFITGTGDGDNGSFTIEDSNLLTNSEINFENKSGYSIRVKVTDQGSETVEKVFVISVDDINEAPSDIALSNNIIPSDQEDGHEVGEFSAVDPEGDDISFNLVENEEDNDKFVIIGKVLQTSGLVTEDPNEKFNIVVESSDSKGSFNLEAFELSVEEIIILMDLAQKGISIYPNPAADFVGFKFDNSFTGSLKLKIISLEGKVVKRHSWSKQDQNFSDRVDLRDLIKGVYLFEITMGNQVLKGKIAKK
ncbi:MAG: T9SS type A sorting domain-containing protein [Marinoscillum sp.]